VYPTHTALTVLTLYSHCTPTLYPYTLPVLVLYSHCTPTPIQVTLADFVFNQQNSTPQGYNQFLGPVRIAQLRSIEQVGVWCEVWCGVEMVCECGVRPAEEHRAGTVYSDSRHHTPYSPCTPYTIHHTPYTIHHTPY
jgi:hypothetical protein